LIIDYAAVLGCGTFAGRGKTEQVAPGRIYRGCFADFQEYRPCVIDTISN
jgi:hypothetical protein